MNKPFTIHYPALPEPYQVSFQHIRPGTDSAAALERETDLAVLRECIKRINNGATICRLWPVLDDGNPDYDKAVVGVAYCAPGDNFSRQLGRRHAFLSAVDELGIKMFGLRAYTSPRWRKKSGFSLGSRSFRKFFGNAFNAWEAKNRQAARKTAAE